MVAEIREVSARHFDFVMVAALEVAVTVAVEAEAEAEAEMAAEAEAECNLSVRFSALFAPRGEELRVFVYST
jgi:hypothetical protein